MSLIVDSEIAEFYSGHSNNEKSVKQSNIVKSTQSTTKHRLYWQRWPVLIFYLVASIVNSIPGEITIPIANELQVIYDTSETFITMAATSYLMMQLLLSLSCSHFIVKYGWATAVNMGVILTILGCAIKLLVNYTGFYMIIIGQVVIGSGRPFILNAQASVAQSWFYPSSRGSIITALNVLNTLSNVATMQIPGNWIFRGYDIETDDSEYSQGHELGMKLNWVLLFISLSMIPCLFVERSLPPTLPSKLAAVESKQIEFLVGMKRLLKNINFILAMTVYSLYFGLVKVLVMVLAYLFKPFDFPTGVVGTAGSLAFLGAMISQASFAILLSRFNHKRIIMCCLMIASCGSTGLLYFALLTSNKYIAYASVCLIGMSVMPIVPFMMDLGCEAVPTISPSFAVGTMYIGATLTTIAFGQLMTIIVGGASSTKTSVAITLLIITGLLVLGFILYLFIRIRDVHDIVIESMFSGRSLLHKTATKTGKYHGTSFFNCSFNIGLIGGIPTMAYRDQEDDDDNK